MKTSTRCTQNCCTRWILPIFFLKLKFLWPFNLSMKIGKSKVF